jgi:septal ring factor EnvC (AmiA/AmiB activator)
MRLPILLVFLTLLFFVVADQDDDYIANLLKGPPTGHVDSEEMRETLKMQRDHEELIQHIQKLQDMYQQITESFKQSDAVMENINKEVKETQLLTNFIKKDLERIRSHQI